jgi:hypothetical protein
MLILRQMILAADPNGKGGMHGPVELPNLTGLVVSDRSRSFHAGRALDQHDRTSLIAFGDNVQEK